MSHPTCPTDAELRAALAKYDASLATRAAASKASADLVELDHWFRTELRPTVASSAPTSLSVVQLGRLMDWKLAVRLYPTPAQRTPLIRASQRGKWRPKLVQLALSNPDALVASCTPPEPTAQSKTALNALCVLKGIGPATASAILSLYNPIDEPFMSDEAYEAIGLGKAEYTVKGWEKFKDAMRKRGESSGWDSQEELEKACWSWGVQKKFGDRKSVV